MNAVPPNPELRRFVDRLLNGEALTKPESARLEELLAEDPALVYYIEAMQQDSLLPHALREVPVPASRPERASLWRKPAVRIAAVAAAIALAFLAGRRMDSSSRQAAANAVPPPETPARLTGLVGVEWEAGVEPGSPTPDGAARRFAIRTGLAELTYGNGVRVTLEGPSDFLVTGLNSARLEHGRVVAAVPKGAEGFHIDYPRGKVVDLGTEFGLETTRSGKTELGVFDGKVELHRPDREILSLTENQAVLLDEPGAGEVEGVPLDREKFVRRIPTRDFRWELTGSKPVDMEFDVSHLVWKAANYRALFKWMKGPDGVEIRNATLCLDGKPVSRNSAVGMSANSITTHDNLLELPVAPNQFHRGRWTLRVNLRVLPLASNRNLAAKPIQCLGIMQFEEGLVGNAGAEDFIGDWAYDYAGSRHVRTFHPNGSVSMTINGQPSRGPMSQSRWTVSDGILHVRIPGVPAPEDHVLRDPDTLIFVKNPYDNAKRVKKDGK